MYPSEAHSMLSLPSMSSTLHCTEDADEVASLEASDAWVPPPRSPASPSSVHEPHRPVSELLAAEAEHLPPPSYVARLHDGSLDAASRRDAINWILKVHAFYGFRPLTAFLAVNYLDRFLSSRALPKGMGWPWQLLSVACLSVAAKMEETDAPPPLDLQILDPRFVFEPKTIRRMELLLMAALQWRMRPVTPFDFVGYFAGLLSLGRLRGERCARLCCRASEIILATQQVDEFLGHRSSAIAAAAVYCAAAAVGADEEDLSPFHGVISKDELDGCRRLLEESLLDASRLSAAKGPPAGTEPPPPPPPPPSPVGVLDAAACGSCDTQDSAAATGPGTVPHATEPPTKRRRLPGNCT